MSADLIITNARVYASAFSEAAEAMACFRGRVVAVGSAAECGHLEGPGTRVINAGGQTILPGLIDSHLHLLTYGLRLRQLDLSGVATLAEALARVAARVEGVAPGEWLLGGGWDSNLWHRTPNRTDLDSVAPGSPVLLSSKDGHSLWVNSEALRRAGLDAGSSDPSGGRIVRDPATGDPTGLLLENATNAAWEAVPAISGHIAEEAVAAALESAVSHGLTGVQTFEGPEVLAAVQGLSRSGELKCRVCSHLAKDNLDDALRLGLATGFGDEWVRFGSLKLFLDGALGSQTAHMLQPYQGTTSMGISTLDPVEYRSLIERAAVGGIATAVHAIGDAANRAALDGLTDTQGIWKQRGLRQRIEHVQVLHPDDVGRFARLGVIASMQPSHATSDWQIADRHWGERSCLGYAWRTILATGAPLAFGSDCPIEPLDPMAGIFAATTRTTPDGQPSGGWYPGETITSRQALHAYTSGSAYASGEERIKGTLEPGKLADFVVLSEDPLRGESNGWLRATVQATVVGGRVVHGSLD